MAEAKPAVERLSEDESLRGDLSDVGFGPLLDWAVAAIKAYAPKAADSDALDAYTNRVRGVVQSAVQAAQDSKLDDPNALVDYDPAGRDKVLTTLTALKLGDDPDDNAVQIAAALQSGLAAAPAGPVTETPAPAQEAAKQAEAPAKQETAQPQQEAAEAKSSESTPPQAPQQEAAQPPLKKNEQAGESASPALPHPNQSPGPEPTANPGPTVPGTGNFLDSMRSRVGQAYNLGWGFFKGLSKRRSG